MKSYWETLKRKFQMLKDGNRSIGRKLGTRMSEDTKVKEAIDHILVQGLEVFGAGIKSRAMTREKWKSDAGDLLDAHHYLISLTASLMSKRSGEPGESSVEIGHRISLTASFIQGIDNCEVLISEGLCIQAANALKQEMETVAATIEVREGLRRDKITPKVGKLPWGLAQAYGDLNKLAHVADERLIFNATSEVVTEDVVGAGISPKYNEGLT